MRNVARRVVEMARNANLFAGVIAWRLKNEEDGAQTLEWIALGVLILAVLAAVQQLATNGGLAHTIHCKLQKMVDANATCS